MSRWRAASGGPALDRPALGGVRGRPGAIVGRAAVGGDGDDGVARAVALGDAAERERELVGVLGRGVGGLRADLVADAVAGLADGLPGDDDGARLGGRHRDALRCRGRRLEQLGRRRPRRRCRVVVVPPPEHEQRHGHGEQADDAGDRAQHDAPRRGVGLAAPVGSPGGGTGAADGRRVRIVIVMAVMIDPDVVRLDGLGRGERYVDGRQSQPGPAG